MLWLLLMLTLWEVRAPLLLPSIPPSLSPFLPSSLPSYNLSSLLLTLYSSLSTSLFFPFPFSPPFSLPQCHAGIVKHIDGLNTEQIQKIGIPNGIPLVYKFDKYMRPIVQPKAVAPLSGEYLEKKVWFYAFINKYKHTNCSFEFRIDMIVTHVFYLHCLILLMHISFFF